MAADYRGIPIAAVPGVHEAAFDALSRSVRPPARVLDLGAGSGAFTQRLLDHGYAVEAVDIRRDGFRPIAPFRALDLNRDFGRMLAGPVDAVTAVELIEHLENPRHFFRQCADLLRPGGVVVVTTPNVESTHSRVTFLVTGRFQWFDETFYRSTGHITPLTSWQLRFIADETGFAHDACAEGPRPSISTRKRVMARLLRPLMRGAGSGDIRIHTFRKS